MCIGVLLKRVDNNMHCDSDCVCKLQRSVVSVYILVHAYTLIIIIYKTSHFLHNYVVITDGLWLSIYMDN